MKKRDFRKLAEKYIKRECTPLEKKLMDKLLYPSMDENNIWNEEEFEIKKVTHKRILEKINKAIDESEIPAGNEKISKNHNFIYGYLQLAKVAAFVLILLSLLAGAVYISGVFSRNKNDLVMNVKKTKAGQKLIITLLDSTTITLNSESQLKIPDNYNKREREVYLKGEAYFDVAHNPEKPFIVHTNEFTIVDIGTAFDVKTFPGENDFSVSLVSGKVSIDKNNSYVNKIGIVLFPNEQYKYNKITGNGNVGKFDYLQAVGWKDNILKFDNEPLKEVLLRLHRAFGIQLDLQDKMFSNYGVTANFHNTSFLTILNSLKKLTRLNYMTETEDNVITKVIFYKE